MISWQWHFLHTRTCPHNCLTTWSCTGRCRGLQSTNSTHTRTGQCARAWPMPMCAHAHGRAFRAGPGGASMWNLGGCSTGAGGPGLFWHAAPAMAVYSAAGGWHWFAMGHAKCLYRADARNSANPINEAALRRPCASRSGIPPTIGRHIPHRPFGYSGACPLGDMARNCDHRLACTYWCTCLVCMPVAMALIALRMQTSTH